MENSITWLYAEDAITRRTFVEWLNLLAKMKEPRSPALENFKVTNP